MSIRDSKFVRRLIISYSILLIVILIMGVYLYNISISNVSKEIRKQNKFNLDKAVNDIDTSFRTMDVLTGQIVSNSTIAQLSNRNRNIDNSFYLLAYNAKEDLSVYVFTESILPIKEYYIYLNQIDYVLSGSQFSSTSLFYKGIRNYYRDQYEDWIALMNTESLYRRFIPIDRFKIYADSTYLYMLPMNEYTFRNVPAVICYEIDFEQLKKIFSELNFYETGYLQVTDQEGNVMFSLKGSRANDISIESLSQLSYDNNFSTYTLEGDDFFVTSTSSKQNQWNYYLVQPEDASLYSLKQYRDIFIASIILGVFIEVLLILFLSRTNIKKITQLGKELTETQSEQINLLKLVEIQKPIIMDTYLAKIVKGNISNEQELDYAQQYLNISTEGRKFSVLFMVAYVNQYELHVDNSAVIGPDNLNYKDIIQTGISQFFSTAIGVTGSNEKEFTILLSSNEDEPIDTSTQLVQNNFLLLHDYLMENYSIWTIAGFGDWNNGLMITWKSLQEAIESISYTTKRNTFRCYSNIERETTGFYYPIELTNQLTNFINSGNQSQVLEIFEIIRHENLEERALPINMMKYLLSDIRNTLFKIRFALKSDDLNRQELDSIDLLFDQHMSLKLCEDIALSLCQLSSSKSSSNSLICTIRDYIDDNYHDPALCLSKISDEFSISESYFSFLFKEELGENFSNYLEHRRMEHAKELITQTEINVSDVFSEVGYNNSHTFRRAFKKIYGVSPKEVRNQVRSI
jgi:two-component system, response regulator YesN